MVPDSDAGDDDLGGASPADSGAGPGKRVDSNWWYWVAAVPIYYVLATAAGFAFAVLAFGLALTGAAGAGGGWHVGPGWHMGPGAMEGLGIGLGFLGAFGVALLLFAVGALLSLLFPLAVYLDAEAIEAAGGDWRPDPALYGLLGLVGVVAQPLQVPLAVYYLYKRHESVGRP
jgi:hypothetical protein